MPGPRFLEGTEISLHTLEREDLPFLQTYRNHPDVRQPLGRERPQNADDLEGDFEGYMQDGTNLLVCHDGEPVGFVALFDWSESAGRVEVAYWIAPEDQDNGYGSEAVELAASTLSRSVAVTRSSHARTRTTTPRADSSRVSGAGRLSVSVAVFGVVTLV